MNSFGDGKKWEGTKYPSFRDAAVGLRLYEDGVKYEKSLDEAIRTHKNPSGAKSMLVSLYQARGHFKIMYENN